MDRKRIISIILIVSIILNCPGFVTLANSVVNMTVNASNIRLKFYGNKSVGELYLLDDDGEDREEEDMKSDFDIEELESESETIYEELEELTELKELAKSEEQEKLEEQEESEE